jgi:hypothetical protein
MSILKWLALFLVVLFSVLALSIVGLAIGGIVTMFAMLFLVLVAEGLLIWRRLEQRHPSEHRS